MRPNLPPALKFQVSGFIQYSSPEKFVEKVNNIMFHGLNSSAVVWKGIFNCTFTSINLGSQLIQWVQVWFSVDPLFANLTLLSRHCVIFLLPQRLQFQIIEWREFRQKDYDSLWKLLSFQIPHFVTDKKLSFGLYQHMQNEFKEEVNVFNGKRRRVVKHFNFAKDFNFSKFA